MCFISLSVTIKKIPERRSMEVNKKGNKAYFYKNSTKCKGRQGERKRKKEKKFQQDRKKAINKMAVVRFILSVIG